MCSIGNDIVDLTAINKQRTAQPRFYSKILSPSEQAQYKLPALSKIPFEIYVWLLWSAKESVYKYAKRLQPNLVFSPVKIILASEFLEQNSFQVSSLKEQFGSFINAEKSGSEIILKFTLQNKNYYTRSVITSNYISTIANDTPGFANIYNEATSIENLDYETQSSAVREFFLKKLTSIFPAQTFQITKSEVGYPIVTSCNADTVIKLSLSHHGSFIAYAFKLN